MKIEFIERMIVAVRDLKESRANWQKAGFGIADEEFNAGGLKVARVAAGAIEIDLCAAADADADGPLATAIRESIARGGGILGWVWAVSDRGDSASSTHSRSIALPGLSEPIIDIELIASGLPGVLTGIADARFDLELRTRRLEEICGINRNTVTYLEHIVVMTPSLEGAIAANEAVGLPCKRIREAGRGIQQAFFKLEQTVIEVVAPTRERPGCWGIALMCADITEAVACARQKGLEATSPKQAIQGGQIARIVAPLDGIAIAYMQAGERIND